mmetsp:Transcript_26284/g.76643  ORF Transcript_26284/g.76643 Transcript_26284/m.76643 type:complete len:210 (+) Transcript_26284:530-1159(+)
MGTQDELLHCGRQALESSDHCDFCTIRADDVHFLGLGLNFLHISRKNDAHLFCSTSGTTGAHNGAGLDRRVPGRCGSGGRGDLLPGCCGERRHESHRIFLGHLLRRFEDLSLDVPAVAEQHYNGLQRHTIRLAAHDLPDVHLQPLLNTFSLFEAIRDPMLDLVQDLAGSRGHHRPDDTRRSLAASSRCSNIRRKGSHLRSRHRLRRVNA